MPHRRQATRRSATAWRPSRPACRSTPATSRRPRPTTRWVISSPADPSCRWRPSRCISRCCLSRRMQRTINYGLLLASVVMVVTAVWLLTAYAVARGDLNQAERHGSAPAQALAAASITAQRARGDQVLNLISRSGSTSFQGDFSAARQQVGPGAGTLLASAAADSTGEAAAQVAAAGHAAAAWYAIS